MDNNVEYFRQLHYQPEPLLIGNVWNVQSAKVYEKSGFKAIATTSAGIAHSLGYEDGENIPFEEYLYIVGRIKECVNLPLSVDIESGFSFEPQGICENILKLKKTGVVGINIEDSEIINGKRTIVDKETFALKIRKTTELLQQAHTDIFINVRCDSFLLKLPNALEDAKERVQLYKGLRIDGVFFPYLDKIEDIKEITQCANLPVNVMYTTCLPDLNTLKLLNIKRVSTGNYLNTKVYTELEKMIKTILK